MITDVQMTEFMKNTVALYLNKANVLINGKKGRISDNPAITPIKCTDTVFLPAQFFAESIGAEYIETKKSVQIKLYDKTMSLSGENLIEGTFYASAEELCGFFGKYLHIEDNGIIIYSDNDMSDKLDWKTNLKMMRKISESYMFEDISGKEIVERIKKNYPDCKHPRLIMTEDKFAKIREELGKSDGDEVYKLLFDRLKEKADGYMNERTSGYELRDGIRLLYVCRENKERMLTLALIYNLTLDEKYAKRAYMEMYASCCFVDWNPYHFLDVGEMTAAVGICYDWLYNWMQPWQRKPVRDAVIKNGINPIIEDFDDKPRKRSWNWRGELADNWCFVIGGVGVGAMAIADETEGADLENCERVIGQTLVDIRRALSLFAPCGGYEEGIIYWGLTMEFFTYHMKSLLSAVGEDFGYIDVPGMRNTNNYLFSMNGSVSIFNYHDAGRAATFIPPQSLFLADYFGEYQQAKPRIDKILNEGQATVMDMCLYDPKFRTNAARENELNVYMPIAETVTMRSGWDKNDIYVGFHCDDPCGGSGHDQMDSGQFVLDAMGENFFLDLGPAKYRLPNRRETYPFRAEGHNTIVINPSLDYGQKFGGTAEIEKYEFGTNGGYAIGNMTNAYADEVKSLRRGVKLDVEKRRVTVQDELVLEKESEFLWSAHTCAEIIVSEDKKSASLAINGKTLFARIVCGDGAEFSVMSASPLPTSPVVPEQDGNKGICKLAINIKKCKKLDLCIAFETQMYQDNEFISLDNWQMREKKTIRG